METIDDLEDFLNEALQIDARRRLLDRGEAWSIMRRNGVLPDDAPAFSHTLDVDLAEYGFAVLRAALSLKEKEPANQTARQAFERAGRIFEAVIRNGPTNTDYLDFYRVIAASAYHLANYSAIAFSIFSQITKDDLNLNIAEQSLVRLILRDIDGLNKIISDWLTSPDNQDATLTAMLREKQVEPDIAVSFILNTSVCRALAYFEFALRTGEPEWIDKAAMTLTAALSVADEAGAVTLWWIIRLTRNLILDLWGQSIHINLPKDPPADADELFYAKGRKLFINSLFARKNAQVELWPSQIAAAQRAIDIEDDLVVALPTSAGKTRIAEITALVTLSTGKRVLIITPLRALSAQTERSFRETFLPLNVTVSSLYGKSGITAGDANALRKHHIIIATPEKLDFALRSDPTIIDDIGLIVLDEGHLIGPSEREIRYEILVQRLLKRTDAQSRRIVCLSAILPEGEQLDDLTAWIRSDKEGTPVTSNWRPTRQRFGTLEWMAGRGKLNYDLSNDGPYVRDFVKTLRGGYPGSLQDLTLMAAWQFAKQSKRVLIFITQVNWLEGYGKKAIKLIGSGHLPSLLEDTAAISECYRIGCEWLGAKHPAVLCLKYGIAVHHGQLPSPFLRELEKLLGTPAIKITIASPTLAQGININAAVMLVPYLVRKGKKLTGEEFANVAGRAGRAFVDVEGLVIHVMFDKLAQRRRDWNKLVTSAKARSLVSGAAIVIYQVAKRLAERGIDTSEDAYEFLTNARELWGNREDEEDEPLEVLVEKLDAIILGLIESFDADADDLPRLLDEALEGSLWARLMARLDPEIKEQQKIVLAARARLIWNNSTSEQRRAHFAMGVGLETGIKIDTIAEELAIDVDRADLAALQGNVEDLTAALISLAKRLLEIRPFKPDKKGSLDNTWEKTLADWLVGKSMTQIGLEKLPMIEDAFIYRLVWALEAIRVRRITLGWTPDDGVIAGTASACLETGVPNYRMSMLIRAGLLSRNAAKKIVEQLDPFFFDGQAMRDWIVTEEVDRLSEQDNWPTAETASIWRRFRQDLLSGKNDAWTEKSYSTTAHALNDTARSYHGATRIVENNSEWFMTTPDYQYLSRIEMQLDNTSQQVLFGFLNGANNEATIHRIGLGAWNPHNQL